MAKYGKLLIERLEDLAAYDLSTGELLFILDEPTEGSIEQSVDTVDVTGKGGRRIAQFDRNKQMTISATNAYTVIGALAAQMGTAVTDLSETNTASVPVIEYVKAKSGKLTLEDTPVAGSLQYIYVANADLTQGDSFELGEDAAKNFSVTGKDITLPTEPAFADGTTFIVIYDRSYTTGCVILDGSESYSLNVKAVMTLLAHDPCDVNKKVYIKVIVNKAKIDGNFTMSLGSDAVTSDISMASLVDPCSTDKEISRWYILGE